MALKVPPNTVWHNPEEWEKQPFFEQINFSDCEGEHDQTTSMKLAQDYQGHICDAIEYAKTLDGGEFWLGLYREWMQTYQKVGVEGGEVVYC